ncbi:ninja-family protein 2-like isoform X2 [Vigna radiata var. radiata]|uniref:Ninja-family protein n=1 Tax=Vigna radiata var. radiata TaxID=3916 RepID=A0A1S3UKS7_VIGRR|nr:ninja-family protein 2-like isoform X2 [Vigna radiata var. radiata]
MSHNPSSKEFFSSITSPFSSISMEGFYSEKSYTNSEQIDLTLKLSPCGQNAEEEMVGENAHNRIMENGIQENPFVVCLAEGEKGLVRFGDLQAMRRVRTGKRLLMKKMQMAMAASAAAAADAEKSFPVSPPAVQPLPPSIDDNFKMFAHPSLDLDPWHEGGVSSRFQISPKQEIDSMVSPEAKQEMTVWPSECMIEKPAKKLKHVSSYHKSDAMNIVREMPCVITAGDDTTGKRIEGLLYKYKRGQVCIVCVCHGCFLSPTEFVMHAGGKEVTDPMKHITVSSDSFYINGDGTAFITHPF